MTPPISSCSSMSPLTAPFLLMQYPQAYPIKSHQIWTTKTTYSWFLIHDEQILNGMCNYNQQIVREVLTNKTNIKFKLHTNVDQNLLKLWSNILAEGHSKAWWPLPPQLLQMTIDTQSRLICPACPQLRHSTSRNGPPIISGTKVDLRHWRATWPDILQMLQTGSLGQSRARCPVLRQLLQAFSLVQSAAMWPGR